MGGWDPGTAFGFHEFWPKGWVTISSNQNRMRLLHMDLYTLFNISNLLCSMRGSTDATWSLLITFVFLNVVLDHTFFNFLNSSSWFTMSCYFQVYNTVIQFCIYICFPCGSAGKESVCNAGDLGLIPGLGRSPGEGQSYQLQYSGLENSMDCRVHGVTKSRTQLSDFHFTSCMYIHIHIYSI